MKKTTLSLLILVLVVALVGCSTPTAAPTNTPAPPAATNTPVPEVATATPTPEAVATETPVPAPTNTPQPEATETPVPEPVATMQVLLIIAPQDFQPHEYGEPRRILEEAGYTAVVASTTLDEAVTMLPEEFKVKPDVTIGDVVVADYDAIIFVGGGGSSVYWDDPIAHRIAQEAVAQEKVLAAICIAPVTLARAGVLDGKQATVFPADDPLAMVQEGGAACTGEDSVVRDGLIITGNGPEAATEFGETILAALQEQ
ncbi:MAG: DJ-1/PfpI family protein [Chloroflexota bacterium]|nr:DJ-1/PfpI family protein [Chloroflexota bacterium]